jgi:hypothetical protein
MGITFRGCGSMVTDLVSVAWVAIPFGLLVAIGRYRQRAVAATTLGLGR